MQHRPDVLPVALRSGQYQPGDHDRNEPHSLHRRYLLEGQEQGASGSDESYERATGAGARECDPDADEQNRARCLALLPRGEEGQQGQHQSYDEYAAGIVGIVAVQLAQALDRCAWDHRKVEHGKRLPHQQPHARHERPYQGVQLPRAADPDKQEKREQQDGRICREEVFRRATEVDSEGDRQACQYRERSNHLGRPCPKHGFQSYKAWGQYGTRQREHEQHQDGPNTRDRRKVRMNAADRQEHDDGQDGAIGIQGQT